MCVCVQIAYDVCVLARRTTPSKQFFKVAKTTNVPDVFLIPNFLSDLSSFLKSASKPIYCRQRIYVQNKTITNLKNRLRLAARRIGDHHIYRCHVFHTKHHSLIGMHDDIIEEHIMVSISWANTNPCARKLQKRNTRKVFLFHMPLGRLRQITIFSPSFCQRRNYKVVPSIESDWEYSTRIHITHFPFWKFLFLFSVHCYPWLMSRLTLLCSVTTWCNNLSSARISSRVFNNSGESNSRTGCLSRRLRHPNSRSSSESSPGNSIHVSKSSRRSRSRCCCHCLRVRLRRTVCQASQRSCSCCSCIHSSLKSCSLCSWIESSPSNFSVLS